MVIIPFNSSISIFDGSSPQYFMLNIPFNPYIPGYTRFIYIKLARLLYVIIPIFHGFISIPLNPHGHGFPIPMATSSAEAHTDAIEDAIFRRTNWCDGVMPCLNWDVMGYTG